MKCDTCFFLTVSFFLQAPFSSDLIMSRSGTTHFGNEDQIRSLLDQSITRYFYDTLEDQSGMVVAEYVWIGGKGDDMRSKSKTLTESPKSVKDLPVWNYDGSSTGKAPASPRGASPLCLQAHLPFHCLYLSRRPSDGPCEPPRTLACSFQHPHLVALCWVFVAWAGQALPPRCGSHF